MELTINNVTKQYGSKMAVDGFAATLTDGIYALLGANGSGKTTLMRMICDVLRPTRGDISLNGTNISKLGESYRELLGFLPQNFGYYPNFTGWDFMMYLSALKGLPKITARSRCEELLRLVNLYDVRKKKIKTYSGGMRQRLGIAQAIINDPRILILDEPTAGLDPQERVRFRNIIADLSRGRIVMLSTHIVSDVAYIADQIMLMKQGKLVLQNDADHICEPIKNAVWNCIVSQASVQELRSHYILTNLHHVGDKVEVRIVSDEQPCAGATPVTPTLEDLYLYFFREEQVL